MPGKRYFLQYVCAACFIIFTTCWMLRSTRAGSSYYSQVIELTRNNHVSKSKDASPQVIELTQNNHVSKSKAESPQVIELTQNNHVSKSKSSSPRVIELTQNNRVSRSKAASRYMIYYCQNVCGGWADRLKGAAIAYVIATLSNRTFGIKLPSLPCPLTDFVQPNEVNWDIPGDVDLKSGAEKYDILDSVKMYNAFASIDFNKVFTSRVVLLKANLNYFDQIKKNGLYREQLEWMQPLTYDQIFANVFRKLFKLSPKVQESLDSTLRRLTLPPSESGKLVCTHLRFAGNSKMSHDTVKRHTKEHGQTMLSFLQSLDPSNPRYNATRANEAFAPPSASSSPSITTNSSLMRFFVTGDSDQFIGEAEEIFRERFVRTAGTFVHVDKMSGGVSKQTVCDGFAKVIVDQQLLSRCDVLVISKSGFSRQAAYLRGTDAGLYCMLLSGNLVKCQRRHVRELYQILG